MKTELVSVNVTEAGRKAEVKATFNIDGLEYWIKETIDYPVPQRDMRFIVARMQEVLERELKHQLAIRIPNSRYIQ
jgi:hypothetical protein